MKAERFRILAGILALRRFTAAELAAATGVNGNTIGSALRRQTSLGRFLQDTGETLRTKSGRPQKIWCIREDKLAEARALFDEVSGPALTRGEAAEAAAAAFADRDTRLMIRRHLLLASKARDPETRHEELEEAQDWLEHERERLADWTGEGFAIPDHVAAEMEELEAWFAGFDLNVDRLGFERHSWDPSHMTDWLTTGLERWFSPMAGPSLDAFHPLRLAPSADVGQERALVSQLLTVLKTADRLATVPLDWLLLALLMALPRLHDRRARNVVCDVLEQIGFDRVGRALQDHTEKAHNTPGMRRTVLHVLFALIDFPALLQNPTVLAWFTKLRVSKLWSEDHVGVYIRALEHLPDGDTMREVREREDDLRRWLDRLQHSDENWGRLTDGINDIGAISGRIRRLLKALSAPKGWSQFFCAGAEAAA